MAYNGGPKGSQTPWILGIHGGCPGGSMGDSGGRIRQSGRNFAKPDSVPGPLAKALAAHVHICRLVYFSMPSSITFSSDLKFSGSKFPRTNVFRGAVSAGPKFWQRFLEFVPRNKLFVPICSAEQSICSNLFRGTNYLFQFVPRQTSENNRKINKNRLAPALGCSNLFRGTNHLFQSVPRNNLFVPICSVEQTICSSLFRGTNSSFSAFDFSEPEFLGVQLLVYLHFDGPPRRLIFRKRFAIGHF